MGRPHLFPIMQQVVNIALAKLALLRCIGMHTWLVQPRLTHHILADSGDMPWHSGLVGPTCDDISVMLMSTWSMQAACCCRMWQGRLMGQTAWNEDGRQCETTPGSATERFTLPKASRRCLPTCPQHATCPGTASMSTCLTLTSPRLASAQWTLPVWLATLSTMQ
jgi:hypothetical protein